MERPEVRLNISEEQFWAMFYYFNHSNWDFNEALISSEWSFENEQAPLRRNNQNVSVQRNCEPSAPLPVQGTSDDSGQPDDHPGDNSDDNSRANDQGENVLEGHGTARCPHCFLSPCVTSHHQTWLGPGANPHPRNSSLRKKRYKLFWKLLSDSGAWMFPEYQNKKRRALGREEDESTVWTVREIMPDCVLDSVRNLYPNIPTQPYMGHKWW